MRAKDTDAVAHEVQMSVYRRMSPEERLQVGLDLTKLSRRLLEEGVRRRHPEYSEAEVRLATIRAWLGPDLFQRAYAGEPELDP